MVKDYFKTATLINPEFLDARIRLAEIYLAEKDLSNAREQIEKILGLKPEGITALNLLSELKLLEGDLKSAEEFCKMILKQSPDYAPGHIRLGLVYKASGKNELALESFKKSLELQPETTGVLRLIVNIYLEEKKYEEALGIIEQYKTSADTQKKAVVSHLEGEVFLKSGEEEKAYNYFKKSMELDPKYLPAYISLGGLLINQKSYQSALPLYEKVLAINTSHIPALLATGYLYDIKGDYSKAEEQYRKILKINPAHVNASNNLAFILSEKKEGIDEAFGLARQAKMKNPKDPNVLDTMGWIFYKKGSYESAISEFKESLQLNPNNPVTCYHLGLAYYGNRAYELARTYLQKAIELDPKFNGADMARQLLNKK